MTEAKAAFAERAIRSFERLLSSYMEGYGYNYIPKLSQFLTTLNFGKIYVMDSIPKNIKNSHFCHLCTASHNENIENPSLKLEKNFASLSMTCPLRTVISHSLHRKFLKLFQLLPENLQHTQ